MRLVCEEDERWSELNEYVRLGNRVESKRIVYKLFDHQYYIIECLVKNFICKIFYVSSEETFDEYNEYVLDLSSKKSKQSFHHSVVKNLKQEYYEKNGI